MCEILVKKSEFSLFENGSRGSIIHSNREKNHFLSWKCFSLFWHLPGGGATWTARGGIRLVHGLIESTLLTYFSGMKIDPKYAFLPVMFFPKFVYMTKNTPFFPILHVVAPLNDVGAYSAWSWKITLITWIFGWAWYPPWHSSGPRGHLSHGTDYVETLSEWNIGLHHVKSIHPLWKILEKCTTRGVWIFKSTYLLCSISIRFITGGVNISFRSAKWAYLLGIPTPFVLGVS